MAYVPSPTLFSFVYLCFVPELAGVGAILTTRDDRQGRLEPIDPKFWRDF
jgi:hypothetical protein